MPRLQLNSDDGSSVPCEPEPEHGPALVGCGGFATCWRFRHNGAACVLKVPILLVQRDEVASGLSFLWPSSQMEHLPQKLRERLQLAVEMARTEGDELKKIQSHPNIIRLIHKVWVQVGASEPMPGMLLEEGLMSLAELQTRRDLEHLHDACAAGMLGYLPASAKPSSCDILLEDEPAKSGMTLGILSGLLFLHQRGLVHTDVHESNILVMNFEVRKGALLLKLIDFGGLSAKGQRCRVVCKARMHPKFEADFEQLARPELDWHALGMACWGGTSGDVKKHPEWLYTLEWCPAKEMDNVAAEMFRYNLLGRLNPNEGKVKSKYCPEKADYEMLEERPHRWIHSSQGGSAGELSRVPFFVELLRKTSLQKDPDFCLEAIEKNGLQHFHVSMGSISWYLTETTLPSSMSQRSFRTTRKSCGQESSKQAWL